MAPILYMGTFVLTWLLFMCWSIRKKFSWVISIGGGFLAACGALIITVYVAAFISRILQLPVGFDFAVEQAKCLSFWLLADLVLFMLYTSLITFMSKLPVAGAITGYLIVMPIFHATGLVYGILLGLGMTEIHSAVGGGIFLLLVTFCLAYWVAVDNVRNGTFGRD